MRKRRESRPRKAHRIARLLASRYEKLRPLRRPLTRRETKPRTHGIVAYDLETTRIGEGTPEPLYITAYGEDFYLAGAVKGSAQLAAIVCERMLTPELSRTRFVAWNGNHFDAYFIARALLTRPEYELRPYFAKGNNLRGLLVKLRGTKFAWEFLDGIAMTGVLMPLGRFLKLFAPDYEKLQGPDFEHEEFDAANPAHRRYAIRDSEGLYHAMMRAQSIVRDTFGIPLSPTIGATGIRIFQRRMPAGVSVWQPDRACLEIIRRVVYRGGYCVAMRRYRGPVWKFDVNQAYAAAMREADMPAGNAVRSKHRPRYARAWIARVHASNPRNVVPFYYRDLNGVAKFAGTEIEMTWLTCLEVEQLEREGWRVETSEFWTWEAHFRMVDFVGELEAIRSTCDGGPSGAIGTMIKAIGNNSYGKTVERLDAIEIQLAHDCPAGFVPYDDLDGEIPCVWFRLVEPPVREYHQPQIGAWITASVRMKIRSAALLAPRDFLYADTDCVMYARPVEGLALDRVEYGKWKIEAEGARAIVVTKKVYAMVEGPLHAKGLNVDRLTLTDFVKWHDGEPPRQMQLQRKNWLRFLMGEEMFAPVSKVGQVIAPVS